MQTKKNHYEYVKALRQAILAGCLLFGLNTNISVPEGNATEQPVLPDHVVRQLNEHIRHKVNMAKFEAERWDRVVTVIAKEIGIKDREFADRVARALCAATDEWDVSPMLMASLMRVESAGDPNAVSPVGALGLTQIMPATGREIAHTLGIEWQGRETLLNPELNVRMGTYYFRTLLNWFDGDIHAALAAYNWGPGYIAKQIRHRRALPVVYPGKILRRVMEQPRWVVVRS